jgi:hypothetical protein
MIAPVEWLQAALSLLIVSDIVENMTSADNGQTWTCELSFYIPSRLPLGHQELIRWTGSWMPSRTSAQFSAVRNCLEALQHICCLVPDFSHFKIEALHAGDVPVPQVSEYWASYNHMDMVKSMPLISELWLFIFVIVITIPHFFILPACWFCSMIVPMLHWACRPFWTKLRGDSGITGSTILGTLASTLLKDASSA